MARIDSDAVGDDDDGEVDGSSEASSHLNSSDAWLPKSLEVTSRATDVSSSSRPAHRAQKRGREGQKQSLAAAPGETKRSKSAK